MIQKELDRLIGNQNAIAALRTGVSALFSAGILDAIRMLGRPRRIKEGENQTVMASEAAWSSGWNDCLDTLLYFEEMYLAPDKTVPDVRMDFGALDRAVAEGNITKEEADAIRSNSTVKYDLKSLSNNIPKPAK